MLAGIIIGVLSLVGSWVFDSQEFHMRFWTNFLHNSVFFTGIAFMAVMFYAICNTAWAGWHTQFKRVWEAMGMFLGVGLILMGIIALGVVFGWHHLYHWADTPSVEGDDLLQLKSAFLNKAWFLVSIALIGVWYLFAIKFRNRSIDEDRNGGFDYKHHLRTRWWTALFLPVAAYSISVVMWQWVMSIDAHWYSTMFAWYSGSSLFVSMIAFTIMLLIYLKDQGYYPNVSMEHFHDLGKFLFAFSIFWTYLWFSQYMLIWYANVGEETVYFKTRQDDYPLVFWATLAINFLLPFFILMRNDTKRKFGSLMFASIVVIFGHWLDFFQMIKPGAVHTAHELREGHGDAVGAIADHAGAHGEAVGQAVEHATSTFHMGYTIPGLWEVGTFIGFLSLFLWVFYAYLGKANLVAQNDPYLSESLHHHA